MSSPKEASKEAPAKPAPAAKPAVQSKPVCKVVFLGAAGVGKTSIINRFMYDQFTRNYETTVGIDYFTKPMNVDDRTVNLQIWDTAGQEQFQSLVPSYIRTSAITILVYDVSDPKTLESAKMWYEKVIEMRGNDVRCVLVGNKLDLSVNVQDSAVKEFIDPIKMPHIQVSAKTGENITELFTKAVHEVSDSDLAKKDSITVQAQPIVTVAQEGKSTGCC
ncbi:GTP-binding protein ryh1 [Tritrichomonas foetus]|uniref:GTP-binding protein ryh1 n=1 Tax=Tritrichomonas foetus TaxID=1144522 RepID=A0A1J4IZA2_9EUKA|nr:GTP-binding protein ryh1 [Tritrichomonas foetus]|eukprot:OHS92742.1 GTP-binding protein ryh1 [Tritrichomonas foetus]